MGTQQNDILIVDDDATIVDLLVTSLRDAGRSICVAYDGASALLAMELHRPALVFLDLHMPGVSGRDVLAQVWWRGLTAIPVVMMTGDEQAAQHVEATGDTECILKPFTIDTIFDCVARYVDQPGISMVRADTKS